MTDTNEAVQPFSHRRERESSKRHQETAISLSDLGVVQGTGMCESHAVVNWTGVWSRVCGLG